MSKIYWTWQKRGAYYSRCVYLTCLPSLFICFLLFQNCLMGFKILPYFFQKNIHYYLILPVSAFLAPQIVEDPKNQTVDAGFNITFNCTAKGHPMPSLKWIKNDNSLAVRSNPRINVSQTFLDNVQIHSQLIIEDHLFAFSFLSCTSFASFFPRPQY